MALVDDMELKESSETRVLRLAGTWTVERAHELKQALVEALQKTDHLIVGLEDLEEADLSCLQLLCSAHGTFLKLGKRMTLQEKRSESFRRAVSDSGFKRNLGCHKAPNADCLWIGDWES